MACRLVPKLVGNRLLLHFLLLSGVLGLPVLRKVHDFIWTHLTKIVSLVQVISAFKACDLFYDIWANSFKFLPFLL